MKYTQEDFLPNSRFDGSDLVYLPDLNLSGWAKLIEDSKGEEYLDNYCEKYELCKLAMKIVDSPLYKALK